MSCHAGRIGRPGVSGRWTIEVTCCRDRCSPEPACRSLKGSSGGGPDVARGVVGFVPVPWTIYRAVGGGPENDIDGRARPPDCADPVTAAPPPGSLVACWVGPSLTPSLPSRSWRTTLEVRNTGDFSSGSWLRTPRNRCLSFPIGELLSKLALVPSLLSARALPSPNAVANDPPPPSRLTFSRPPFSRFFALAARRRNSSASCSAASRRLTSREYRSRNSCSALHAWCKKKRMELV